MSENIDVRVRFCETDALGHVNNTSYFIYLEEARVQFFEYLGKQSGTDDWPFILVSTKCDFIKQVYFKQALRIETSVKRIGSKSFTLLHLIKDTRTNDTLAEGEATVVYFDFKKQTSEIIPDELRKRLEESYQLL
ncbi:acyl-CoA thioesterase [Pseudalkalibacillus hwajinpoensis]|uniref:Acyl-CoA thioesterase n=1 Tax=Guptibacillus hwajinpoensis TaxID=208199 RepID=A0A4U1MIT2_9BACL|nr:thioesterase family protein [Pseudalkalibacillus hwajinpoensis]TKD71289.1 acyl-CoA thioesterase [Pseudalkalibacillus hwajinpoensis]